MHPKTDKSAKTWAKAGILISWSTFWFFLLVPFGLLAWVGILFSLINKSVSLKRYFLLSAWVFVPSCSFMTGTASYFTGSASLNGLGGPQIFHGIDRETRAAVTTSGCIAFGFEPFVNTGNNLAVSFWTNLLGYQRGAYTGIYPTQEEAIAALVTADTLEITRHGSFYQFNMDRQALRIDTGALDEFYYDTEPLNKVVGKILNNECFIFQPVGASKEEGNRGISLLDIKDSRILTVYESY